jgi:hypothetical protein
MPDESIDFGDKYRQAMKCHSMGVAMYEPTFASKMKPGSCGYLNKLGNWQPMFDLSDEDTLKAAGITAPERAIAMPVMDISTPKPLHGNATRSKEHKVELEPPLAAATGVPVTCSVWWDFTSKYGFGTVLACPSGLRKEGYFESADWAGWAKENAAAIIKYRPKIKEHNLWIITTTYTTKEAWINVWGDSESTVSIGFSAGVEGIAKVAPSVAFSKSASGSNWRTIPAPGTAKEDVVVFFHGVQMQFSRIPFGMASLHEVRGESHVVQDPESEEKLYLKIETAGF